VSEPQFRRAIVWLVGSRLVGTLLGKHFLSQRPCSLPRLHGSCRTASGGTGSE
jgi:hypothetical protein